jgi:hypothetical protein
VTPEEFDAALSALEDDAFDLVAAAIDAIVDAAPPLTPSQRAGLRRLLGGA